MLELCCYLIVGVLLENPTESLWNWRVERGDTELGESLGRGGPRYTDMGRLCH